MKSPIRTALAGIGLSLAAGSFAVGGIMFTSDHHDDVVMHEVSADYPSFDTVGDIAAQSMVVVRATAQQVSPAYRDLPAGLPVDQLPDFKAEQLGTMQQDVTFRVDRALKGNIAAGSELTVVQLGGQIGRDLYVIDEEPMSVSGRSYVLFLAPLADGKFGIVGGPEGRYEVDKGSLRSLSEDAQHIGVGRQLHNMPLASFERDFNGLAAQRGHGNPAKGSDEPLNPMQLPGNKD